MAKTYTYGDVLSLIANQIPKVTEEDKAPFILNMALNKVWKRYDWPESLAALPPFSLTPGEQDHGSPQASVPSDFYGLREANLVELNGLPAVRTPLHVHRNIPLTDFTGMPREISWEPSVAAFRLHPRVPLNIGTPLYMVDGKYKIRPTKLTSSVIHSTLLPFDDLYIDMWVALAKWAAWDLAGNPMAGDVVYSARGVSFSGQLAKAMSAIDLMASDAGLLLGDGVISPSEMLW
jgi:hypothetical protein